MNLPKVTEAQLHSMTADGVESSSWVRRIERENPEVYRMLSDTFESHAADCGDAEAFEQGWELFVSGAALTYAALWKQAESDAMGGVE